MKPSPTCNGAVAGRPVAADECRLSGCPAHVRLAGPKRSSERHKSAPGSIVGRAARFPPDRTQRESKLEGLAPSRLTGRCTRDDIDQAQKQPVDLFQIGLGEPALHVRRPQLPERAVSDRGSRGACSCNALEGRLQPCPAKRGHRLPAHRCGQIKAHRYRPAHRKSRCLVRPQPSGWFLSGARNRAGP